MKNVDVEARISPYLVKEDLSQIQDKLDHLTLEYNKGLITKDHMARQAYEILLTHPAAREAIEWFGNEMLADAQAAGAVQMRMPL